MSPEKRDGRGERLPQCRLLPMRRGILIKKEEEPGEFVSDTTRSLEHWCEVGMVQKIRFQMYCGKRTGFHALGRPKGRWRKSFKNWKSCPGWCGLVDWVLACEAKGHWFDSQWGHMPGLGPRSPKGGTERATTHWCFIPSLSPSLPLFLKINKI